MIYLNTIPNFFQIWARNFMSDSEASLFLCLTWFSISMRNSAYRNRLNKTQIAKGVSEAIATQNHLAENDVTCGTNIFRIHEEKNFKKSEERL